MFVEFSNFAFDMTRGALSRDGVEVPLSGTAAKVLRILIDARGQTVEKAYLLGAIWNKGGTEYRLTTAVAKLRLALGDSRDDARFVRTDHGRGYAFIAKLTVHGTETAPAHSASSFVLEPGPDRQIVLLQGENIIGRDTGQCTICLPDTVVSRRHASILVNGKQASIKDLGSRHGTLVGRHPVIGWTKLNSGDLIQFGTRGPMMTFRRTDTDTVRTDPR